MVSFKSRITQRILGYFFSNPEESLYTNEIVRKLGVDKRNLVKKLKELETERLLATESRGNLTLYHLNTSYPLLQEYRRIFMKTAGTEARLRAAVGKVAGIRAAWIYGSYARDAMSAQSDIDVLVVGTHRIASFQKEIIYLQNETDREINCVHMSEEEFSRKKAAGDPFLEDIFRHRTIDLFS